MIALGEVLLQTKAELPRGEWKRLFAGHPRAVKEPVRFSVRAAQMLMKIAWHRVLSQVNLGSPLPPSRGTLYEVTKAGNAAPFLEQRPRSSPRDAASLHRE